MPPKGPKAAAPKAGPGRKGPPAAMIAKLKQHMEKQKEEEERLRREQEEEERRLREEERLAEEQRKFEEEERARERQRRKEEERMARKEGTKDSRNDVLQRMAAAGFIVPDVERIREEQKREQEVPRPKQPRPKQVHKPQVVQETKEPEDESSDEDDGLVTEPSDSEEEIDEDDWEAIMDRDDRREKRRAKNEAIRQQRIEAQRQRQEKREEKKKALADAAAAERAKEHVLESVSKLRSPICCVLGHVDTGKTSLLDRIRATNVQGGEAGGITQQIGATFFPRESLFEATQELNKKYKHELNVPGLLVIDTPGHESFTNLRSRGSSLCDIAILVIDIMHGLEPQTRESIRLLRERRCPFIIALNKVDRLYDWEAHKDMDIERTLSMQKDHVRGEFDTRLTQVKQELLQEGLNSELYYRNTEVRKVVSIVPTSAKTGEGISDLILLEVQLVQQFMEGKVTYKDDLQCTILEVKPTTGYGITVDAISQRGL
ncbi:unnamed protein product, partial [Trypanosoma congolense IL3000]